MVLSGVLDLEYDDGLQFRFILTNTGDEPLELRFRDSQTADFSLFEDGNERWRWSDGRLFTQALRAEPLEPGATTIYKGEWESPEPGGYTARATLCAENHDCGVERTVALSGETLSFDPS